jgi:hypothetical protein
VSPPPLPQPLRPHSYGRAFRFAGQIKIRRGFVEIPEGFREAFE